MTPYGQAALDAEVAALRSTGNGGRNAQLNRSAFAVAQLVAGNEIDAEPARAALREAANESGLERREVETTIASGWNAGVAVPRYPYRDQSGRTLYAKARVDRPASAKRPAQKYEYQQPDGKGGWTAGRDADAVPYRLPELIAAPKDAVIYMAEGEKHADKLASWGLVATSHKDWKGFEFSGYVRGRTVVILPDNDVEGAACAERAANAVELAEGRALFVRLPRLPDKGDIMDWDGDAAELAALVEAAVNPPVATFPIADLAAWSRTAAIVATPFVWRDPATIPHRPWLLGKWLLAGTTAAIIAPGGVGKSTFTATMALSLASGRPLLGKAVHDRPRATWLWNLEDDCDELARQLQAAAIAHNVTPKQVDGRLFVDSALDGAGLCTAEQGPDGFKLIRPVTAAIEAELKRRCVECLIVDPFVSSHAVSENDNNAIDAVAKEWGRVARAAGCCVVLVHHARKPNGERVTAEHSRGASALANATRTTLVLNRMDDREAERFGIQDVAERRSLFTVDADKINRAPAEAASWFKLHGEMLGNGGPFEGGDSVGVAMPWTPPDAFEGVTLADLIRVQDAVTAAGEDERRKSDQSAGWVGHIVASTLDLNSDDKGDRAKVKRMLAEWTRNGAFTVASTNDEKGKPRPILEVGERAEADPSPPRNTVVENGGGRWGSIGHQNHLHHHLPFRGVEGGGVEMPCAGVGGGGGEA